MTHKYLYSVSYCLGKFYILSTEIIACVSKSCTTQFCKMAYTIRSIGHSFFDIKYNNEIGDTSNSCKKVLP